MKTKEIPRNEWQEFFDIFSRQHEGWLVTLEIFGSEIGAQVEERGLAFEGIVDEGDDAPDTPADLRLFAGLDERDSPRLSLALMHLGRPLPHIERYI